MNKKQKALTKFYTGLNSLQARSTGLAIAKTQKEILSLGKITTEDIKLYKYESRKDKKASKHIA